jgi:rhodanese-related sulfurtransferase
VIPRRALALVLPAVLAVGGLSACSSSDTTVSVTNGPTAAPAAGSNLEAAAFAVAVKAPETVILDVRTPAEFAEGHIPGAVNIDVQSPDFTGQVAALDPNVSYAVYCRTGNRSQQALDLMAEMGIMDAYHLVGGVGAWQQAGGELVTGE